MPATILPVEDNEDVASMICLLLQQAGFQTRHAATAGQGMLLGVTQPSSLFLLDVDLPDGDGFCLCRQLKAHPVTGGVPVIICTGRPDALAHALAAGAVDCVSKPDEVMELPVRIQRALDCLRSDKNPKPGSIRNPVDHHSPQS